MGKPKTCYGATPQEYTCLTRFCPYVAGCVKLMDERRSWTKRTQDLSAGRGRRLAVRKVYGRQKESA